MPDVVSTPTARPAGDALLDEIGRATVAAYASATQSTVATLQQLNRLLVSSLTAALAKNQLAGAGTPPNGDDDEQPEANLAAAGSASAPLQESLDAVLARVRQSTGAAAPLPASLLASAAALAVALDLLDAVVLQQAINVTRAVLSTEVELQAPGTPVQAFALAQVLRADAVAQTLTNLAAAAPASNP